MRRNENSNARRKSHQESVEKFAACFRRRDGYTAARYEPSTMGIAMINGWELIILLMVVAVVFTLVRTSKRRDSGHRD